MATTLIKHARNTDFGREMIVEVQLGTYATSGEVWALTAAPFTGANALASTIFCEVQEGPYDSAGLPIDQAVCSKAQYAPAASRALATGTLFAFAEDAGSGITTE